MTDDREPFREARAAGLEKRQEAREDRFHERVREVIAGGLVGTYWNTAEGPPRVDISAEVAETIAPRAYQSLLDAGYLVIPGRAKEPEGETAEAMERWYADLNEESS